MDDIWDILFELAPIKRAAPPSTLYDVIVDTRDLATVKRYVAGGHAIDEQFAGGHSVNLAVKRGNLEFVRYFVEAAGDIQSLHDLLTHAVRRVSEATDENLAEAEAVLDYLLQQPLAEYQLTSGFQFSAGAGQFSAAKKILAAGLEDHEVRIGEDEYQLLSERLVALGHSAFASLLKGEPVDEDELEQNERRERKINAKLRSNLDDLVPFEGQKLLTGAEFDDRYEAFLNEIEAGTWDEALGSTDKRFGRSVMEFAAEHGFVDLVLRILGRNAVSAEKAASFNRRAAVAAATHGHIEVLEVLQANGAGVPDTPKGENSPLSEACRYGHLDVVEYLLGLGADPNSGDGSGHNLTLLDIAGGEQRETIIAALKEQQA